MIPEKLKILLLENSATDAATIKSLLKSNYPDCDVKVVVSKNFYQPALTEFKPDLILSDTEMPDLNGMEALQILQQHTPDIPFILIAGTASEEFVAGIIKAGAADYLVKDRLARLPAAIQAALKQKQTEKEKQEAINTLKQSEEKYRTLIEQASDGIFIADKTGRYTDVNESGCRTMGYSKEELLQLEIKDLLVIDEDYVVPGFDELNLEKAVIRKRKLKRKDGSSVNVEISAKLLQNGNYFASVRDLTERLVAEEKLQKEKKLSDKIINSLPGLFYLSDPTPKLLRWNKAFEEISGYTAEELSKTTPTALFDTEDQALLRHSSDKTYRQGLADKEARLVTRSGQRIPFYFTEVGIEYEGEPAVIGTGINISEKIKADKLLNDERDKFSKIAATSPGLIYSMRMDKDGVISYPYLSEAIKEIYGFTIKEINRSPDKIFKGMHAGDAAQVMEKIISTKTKMVPLKTEYRYLHPVKGLVWHEVSSLPVGEPDGAVICHGIVLDITERKNTEQKILKANRLYFFISQINQMIVRTKDTDTLFKEVCRIAAEVGKFRMAWIGIIDKKTGKVKPVMHAGEENGYLSEIKTISVDNSPEGKGPTGTALRTGKYIVCNDIENDASMATWKEAALSRQYLSSMSLPIKKNGCVTGAISVYAPEKNFFDAAEISLLEEAAADVSFALDFFEKEERRKKAEDAVKESERRYHTLTEIAPVGIFHTDADGTTTYVNPAWCKISGLSPEQALGNGWLKGVHHDDREPITKSWQKATTEMEMSLSEYRFVHPGGSIAWVIGQAIPERNSAYEVIGYVGTITDITAHKNAENVIIKEQQLSENIISNLPGIFYLYDENGNFLRWNKNFENITGYSNAEIAGMHPLDFYDEDERQKISARIKKVFSEKPPGIEVEIFTKNKNKIPYYINSVAIEYKGKKCLLGMGVDLSERKKAEQEIKKANERYELIGKATSDGLWDWDLATNKVWGNDMHQQLYGLKLTDPVPDFEEWKKRIHPEDRERTVGKLEQAKSAAGNSYTEEYRFFTDNKGWINIYGRTFIERTREGRAARLIGSMLDITENKKGEEHIKRSEEKRKLIMNAALDAIICIDTKGIITFWNQKAKQIFGWNEEEVMGRLFPDIIIPKALRKMPLHELKNYLLGAKGEAQNNLQELMAVNRKGKEFPVETMILPIKQGAEEFFCAFIRDISGRKKAEEAILLSNERYNLVSKATNDSIWDLDITTGKISRTGDGFKNLFGYYQLQTGKDAADWKQLIYPEDLKRVMASQQMVFDDTNEFYWEQEYRFLKAGGEYAYVYDKGYVIRDTHGKAIRMIGATQDVTKLRENEMNLISLNKHLQVQAKALAVSNAELEQFAYVASHDLQEPLRMVTSFLTLLEKHYGHTFDDTAKKYIDFAIDGARRMKQIILDILEFSRVGRVGGIREDVDLQRLVKDIQQLYRKQIEEKLAVITADTLPVIIASEAPLRQIFQNLIGNALKYTKADTPCKIIITAVEKRNNWLFAVKDNGIGIEAEYFERIFIIFQRLHTQTEFSGTGIGLAITKKIIENLGGKIWVESEYGAGSTFYFTLKK
jgi:PAS domain S-box-containing protein